MALTHAMPCASMLTEGASSMAFVFQPIDETSARAVVAWRYPPPYEVYNEEPERMQQVVEELLRAEYHYYRMAEGSDPLVAYCCFGLDARVAGGDYDSQGLDLGLMVRPDLNGQGRGAQFAEAVLEFAQRTFPHRLWRVTIAEFNQRAQRVWQKLGFHRMQTFPRRGDGLTFGTWMLCGVREGQQVTLDPDGTVSVSRCKY
jgi:RimJ/RimL family protein N-acetyltransferase